MGYTNSTATLTCRIRRWASAVLEVENSYSAELVVEVARLMRKPTTPTAATTANRRMSFFMRGACHGVFGGASPLLQAP